MRNAPGKTISGIFTPSGFRDLVSGRRRGAVAAVLRGMLATAEVPHAWAVRRRNRRYDRGASKSIGLKSR